MEHFTKILQIKSFKKNKTKTINYKLAQSSTNSVANVNANVY